MLLDAALIHPVIANFAINSRSLPGPALFLNCQLATLLFYDSVSEPYEQFINSFLQFVNLFARGAHFEKSMSNRGAVSGPNNISEVSNQVLQEIGFADVLEICLQRVNLATPRMRTGFYRRSVFIK